MSRPSWWLPDELVVRVFDEEAIIFDRRDFMVHRLGRAETAALRLLLRYQRWPQLRQAMDGAGGRPTEAEARALMARLARSRLLCVAIDEPEG